MLSNRLATPTLSRVVLLANCRDLHGIAKYLPDTGLGARERVRVIALYRCTAGDVLILIHVRRLYPTTRDFSSDLVSCTSS